MFCALGFQSYTSAKYCLILTKLIYPSFRLKHLNLKKLTLKFCCPELVKQVVPLWNGNLIFKYVLYSLYFALERAVKACLNFKVFPFNTKWIIQKTSRGLSSKAFGWCKIKGSVPHQTNSSKNTPERHKYTFAIQKTASIKSPYLQAYQLTVRFYQQRALEQ